MENKALITGSSRGLGLYLAKFFNKKGYKVILHGRNEDDLKNIIKSLPTPNDFEYFSCDLSKNKEIKSLCNFAIERKINVLINNAGITCPGLSLNDLSDREINFMLDVNLKANIFLTKYLNAYVENIININSMVGIEPKKNRSIYSATKFGMRGFSQSLNLEDISCKILDVYPTNIQTWPGRENAMDINYVLNEIYDAMIKSKENLILDGRK
jgi:short-subunit dehydrogenase